MTASVRGHRGEDFKLGLPRADRFRPPNVSASGEWEGFVTKEEIIQIACDRATGMLAEASAHTLDMMSSSVLQVWDIRRPFNSGRV